MNDSFNLGLTIKDLNIEQERQSGPEREKKDVENGKDSGL